MSGAREAFEDIDWRKTPPNVEHVKEMLEASKRTCLYCKGLGVADEGGTCLVCDGEGWVYATQQPASEEGPRDE